MAVIIVIIVLAWLISKDVKSGKPDKGNRTYKEQAPSAPTHTTYRKASWR